MKSTMRIERRFRGPPTSGNGGYVAGLLAKQVGGYGCVVTLKSAPPLERDFKIESTPATSKLWLGDKLIAEAEQATIDVDVPPSPGFDSARQAEARFTGLHDHVFPDCFVCGPNRHERDGLRIFPGPILEHRSGVVASAWVPDPDLADEAGVVRPEFVWAALDCPGYFAVQAKAGPAVLGRLGVNCYSAPSRGTRLIVTGWPIESSGRKHNVGTAIHDEHGRLLAAASATWISISVPDWKG